MPRLTRPVDPRPLAVARIAVGVGILFSAFEATLYVMAAIESGTTYPFLTWAPTMTSTLALAYLAVAWLAGVLLVIGLFSRVAGAVVFVTTVAIMVLEQQTYSNHFTLVALSALWLAFGRPDSAWSIRARREGRAEVRLHHQILLMSQLSICYLFAGVSKLNEPFLSGEVLDIFLRWDFGSWLAQVMSVAAVATELALAVGLWLSRVRWVVGLLGVSLHVSIPVLMGSSTAALVAFSLVSVGLYPLFFTKDSELKVVAPQTLNR